LEASLTYSPSSSLQQQIPNPTPTINDPLTPGRLEIVEVVEREREQGKRRCTRG
jgi:hypothetical protein